MFGRNKLKEEAKEHDNQEIIEPKESGDASTSLMFQKMQAIASFSPSKNLESEISDYVKEIVQKLRHNDPELKVLDLKKKELASLEKKAIFAALALNHTVEEADFSATYFTPEDAKDFARAFSVTDNYTLKLLILNYNELGDEGIERIVRANLHLDKLVAICCEITDVGAEKIAECSTIPDVHLNQNYIHEKGVAAMIKNPYFSEGTFLSLGIGNPINDTRALKEKQASFKLGK